MSMSGKETVTRIYFVRHAQSQKEWEDGETTRPLTEEGLADAQKAFKAMGGVQLDVFFSSPYKRAVDTIKPLADFWDSEIITDQRLRERDGGRFGSLKEHVEHRWLDFTFAEEGGESLGHAQERNINALREIVKNHPGKTVCVGTHGTALSTILNYFDSTFGYDSYRAIANLTPYIIRLDFEGETCLGKQEIFFVDKSK